MATVICSSIIKVSKIMIIWWRPGCD